MPDRRDPVVEGVDASPNGWMQSPRIVGSYFFSMIVGTS